MSYECVLFSVRYAVCLRSPNGRGTEEGALAAHQALYRSQFSRAAYQQFIQIPRDPANPLVSPQSWVEQENLPGLGEGGEEAW